LYSAIKSEDTDTCQVCARRWRPVILRKKQDEWTTTAEFISLMARVVTRCKSLFYAQLPRWHLNVVVLCHSVGNFKLSIDRPASCPGKARCLLYSDHPRWTASCSRVCTVMWHSGAQFAVGNVLTRTVISSDTTYVYMAPTLAPVQFVITRTCTVYIMCR